MKLLLTLLLLSFSVAAEENVAQKRLQEEAFYKFQNFTLLSHKQNYLLPVTYNFSPNNQPNESIKARGTDTGLDRVMRVEAKFQLSFKFPVASSVIFDDDQIWAAYTQKSFWQVYNQNSSRPFRESNYEPEIFYSNPMDLKLGAVKLNALGFGLVHQSNGQIEILSRSWNRIYMQFIFSAGKFALSLKPWYRIPDGDKDDNPNIERYMGYGEATLAYKNAGWVYSLLLRNSLKGKMRGYRELGINFPIDQKIKGFFQFVNGYGESLLDFNANSNRIGLGIIISDFI